MSHKKVYLIKLVFLLSITAIFADDCIVFDYNKVEEAIKKCTILNIKDMTVPANTTLLLDLQNGTKLTFSGRLTFEPAAFNGYLIAIRGDNLTVIGDTDHVIDGQGPQYWHGYSKEVRPYFMSISATNSNIRYLNLLNSPSNCVSIGQSKHLHISGFFIDNRAGYPGVAPEGFEAKNTDGFDINTSDNVTVEHSVIYNQDACVAINDGTNYVINDLECHGSHGLTLSVGFGIDKPIEANSVKNVTFRNCRIIGGENAIHIKTHTDAGLGLIDNVEYHNISLTDVERVSVYVQQNYLTGDPRNNIPITNLKINDITGTMTGPRSIAVQVVCASGGCSHWKWGNIEITGAHYKSSCNYIPPGFAC